MAIRCALIAGAVALSSAFAVPAAAAKDPPNTPVALEVGSVGKMNYTLGKKAFGLQADIGTVGTLQVAVTPNELARRGFKRWEIVAAMDGEPEAVNKVLREAHINISRDSQSRPSTASGAKRHTLGDVQRLDIKPKSVTVWMSNGARYGLNRSSGHLQAKGVMPWLRRVIRRPAPNDVIRPK